MKIKTLISRLVDKVSDFYRYLISPCGNSSKFLQNIISLNIAFLSIVFAFYIAVSTYFTPQLKQLEIERDLQFNRMLVSLDKLNYGVANPSKNMQYYKNDTLNIDKITLSIMGMSSWASKIFEDRNHYSIEELTLASFQYIDTLKLISLISNYPILNLHIEKDSTVKQIVRGQNYIPYNNKLFIDIDNFFRTIRLYKQVYLKKDLKLIEFCSGCPFFVGADSTGKKDYTWVYKELDSLNQAYEQNPTYLTKKSIKYFEETIQRNKSQLSRYSNFYENIDSVYKTFIVDISELNFKEALFKNILSSLKKLNKLIIFIFIFNIIFPLIFFNIHLNGRIALLYLLAGFIPYIFLIKVC